jgi:hypothetical protein
MGMKNKGQNGYVPGDIYLYIYSLPSKTSVTGICVSKFFGGLSPNLMKWGEITLMNDLLC